MESRDVNDNQELLFESISALIDNELSPSEEAALMLRINADSSLLEKWRHFYIIKTVMKKQVQLGFCTDEFVSKVMVHSEANSIHLVNQKKDL